MNKQTDKQTLATGADLTPALFEDFRQRLIHHCRGEGVADHCTADAIFIVRARRLVYGFGPDYIDNRVVIHEDRKHFSPQEYWDDLNEEERAELNEAAREHSRVDFLELCEDDQWEVLGELEDHTVTGWDSRWEYVNVHFAREAAEAFIQRKAHDYPLGLRIYVDAQLYCWEWNTIKAAIMDGRLGLVDEPPAEQQPVAWRWMCNGEPDGPYAFNYPLPDDDVVRQSLKAERPRTVQPLYAAPIAQAEQSEVQRLRVALEHCLDVMKDPWKHGEGCISRAIYMADAALAAAQEVEK